MKNRILCFVGIILCLIVLMHPVCATAQSFDAARSCDLRLTYAKEGVAFSNLEIKLYRIAKTTDLGVFEKVAPYDDYPVSVAGITSQTEWNEVASTLHGYVQADGLTPYRVATTDENGNATFDKLETGLYLVSGVTVQGTDASYIFHDFMLSLPATQDGECVYQVSAAPKSTKTEPTDEPVTYTILKLWQDEGHEKQRPAEITVDLLKDGTLAQTVILNAQNGWKYSFQCEDGASTWTVVERNVPQGYTVKVTGKETSFVLVNTWEGPPVDPPKTGDTFPLRLYMVATFIAGAALVMIGVLAGRKNHEQEK